MAWVRDEEPLFAADGGEEREVRVLTFTSLKCCSFVVCVVCVESFSFNFRLTFLSFICFNNFSYDNCNLYV